MNGIAARFTGRLPRDAELRYTSSGLAFQSFSVAVDDGRRGADDPTEWARVTVWDALAEELDGQLVKGATVSVEGRLRLQIWHGPEVDRPTLSVSAWSCAVLGSARRSHSHSNRGHRTSGAVPAGSGRPTPAVLDRDDEPF